MTTDAGMAQIADQFAGLRGPAAGVAFSAGAAAAAGDVDGMMAAAAAAHHRPGWTWDDLHPFDLPDPQQSTAAGAIQLTSEHWGPRTGLAWDVKRLTVSGLAAADVVKIYKSGVAAAAGVSPVTEVDVLTGAGSGTDTYYSGSKGALLLQPGDALIVAGTVTSVAVTVTGSGLEVTLARLPDYLS